MQTPAGKECSYFYGDYYRGRNREECRLLKDAALSWAAHMCATCPMPSIQLANSCQHMQFTPELRRPLLIGKQQVHLSIYCDQCQCTVSEPEIGCGQCHSLPNVFVVADNDPDPAA